MSKICWLRFLATTNQLNFSHNFYKTVVFLGAFHHRRNSYVRIRRIVVMWCDLSKVFENFIDQTFPCIVPLVIIFLYWTVRKAANENSLLSNYIQSLSTDRSFMYKFLLLLTDVVFRLFLTQTSISLSIVLNINDKTLISLKLVWKQS